MAAKPLGAPSLLALAWPIFVERLLLVAIVLVDALMLSQVSDEAAAGAGAAGSALYAATILQMAFAQAVQTLAARRLGAGNYAGMDAFHGTSLVLGGVLGAGLSCLLGPLGSAVCTWLHLTGDVGTAAEAFFQVSAWTLWIQSLLLTGSALLKAYGHTRLTMGVSVGMNVVNLLCCLVAVHGWGPLPPLGSAGVAWAGAAARAFGVVLIAYAFFRTAGLRLQVSRESLRETVRPMGVFGATLSVEPLLYKFSQLFITEMVASLGAASLAARTYLLQVTLIHELVAVSLGQAVSILVGYGTGARDFTLVDKSVRSAVTVCFGVCFGLVALTLLGGGRFLGLFTRSEEILRIGAPLLILSVLSEPGRTSNIVVGSSLKAVGDPRFPTLIALVFMWGWSVPASWFLGIKLGYGLGGIVLAMSLDELIRGGLNLWRWQSKLWIPPDVRPRAAAPAAV